MYTLDQVKEGVSRNKFQSYPKRFCMHYSGLLKIRTPKNPDIHMYNLADMEIFVFLDFD